MHRGKILVDSLAIQIDLKKFAEMAGFKNANSANVSFGGVKKKVMGEAGSTKSTPKQKTPSKRKEPTFDGANADDPDETPTKKVKTSTKKTPKKELKAKAESDEDESPAFV